MRHQPLIHLSDFGYLAVSMLVLEAFKCVLQMHIGLEVRVRRLCVFHSLYIVMDALLITRIYESDVRAI